MQGEAWELYEMAFGTQSEQVGNCYIEIASVHNKKKDMDEAIQFQQKALATFSQLEKYSNTEFLAHIAITLSELQEKVGKFDEALESMMQAKGILEDNYGLVDKRTTRVKRNISLIRLKLGMIPEALQEMKEVEVSLELKSHLQLLIFSFITFSGTRNNSARRKISEYC